MPSPPRVSASSTPWEAAAAKPSAQRRQRNAAPPARANARGTMPPRSTANGTEWESPRSGVSVRLVEGSWDSATGELTLRDVSIEVDEPNPGWRFCTIDHYDLTLTDATAGRLEGTYFSEACNDLATVELQREMPAVVP